MRAKMIEKYLYDGYIYTHFEYIADQHRYNKMKTGGVLNANATKEEFLTAQAEGEFLEREFRK